MIISKTPPKRSHRFYDFFFFFQGRQTDNTQHLLGFGYMAQISIYRLPAAWEEGKTELYLRLKVIFFLLWYLCFYEFFNCIFDLGFYKGVSVFPFSLLRLQVDLGWVPGTHQNCSTTPLHKWIWERKYSKWFMGWDKDWKRSLIKQCHWQNRLNMGILTEFITNHIRAG